MYILFKPKIISEKYHKKEMKTKSESVFIFFQKPKVWKKLKTLIINERKQNNTFFKIKILSYICNHLEK